MMLRPALFTYPICHHKMNSFIISCLHYKSSELHQVLLIEDISIIMHTWTVQNMTAVSHHHQFCSAVPRMGPDDYQYCSINYRYFIVYPILVTQRFYFKTLWLVDPYRARAYPHFCSLKQTGVFLLLIRWDTSPSRLTPPPPNKKIILKAPIYTLGWREVKRW